MMAHFFSLQIYVPIWMMGGNHPMLSQRITALFHLLQCTNSDIARYAECSPSNISRLKSGLREPEPDSRAIQRLARGIYRYADYENMLSPLCQLCGVDGTQPDALIPAIIAWLYGDQAYRMPQEVTPKSKREEVSRLQRFGDRLDRAMTLLDYTNGRLAADLNVDASLISRYRAGIYHPNRNAVIRRHLVELLFARADKLGRTDVLAGLCGADETALSPDALSEWMYAPGEPPFTEIAESLLRSIESFVPGRGMPAAPPRIPSIRRQPRYWGTEGLRSAVVRFLTDAARAGGELLLYSDEPMDWMSADPEYFALWAALMVACVQKGVRIKIIHNVDRGGAEMVSAITGWFPLYMSGMIEPYVFSRAKNPRFYHTVFLRPDGAGILGFFPAEAGEDRWYDYITDREQLRALQAGYHAMLGSASPFLKTYPADRADAFWAYYMEQTDKTAAILSGLSLATLPENLLRQMLAREDISQAQRDKALAFHHASREHLSQLMKGGELHELLCLPDPRDIREGKVCVNFEAEMNGLRLAYTSEAYAAHIDAAKELIRREKNYHITLLPQAPFQGLQVFAAKDGVAVIRCKAPFFAFVFHNATLAQSVAYYCDHLTEQYATDRFTAVQTLEALRAQIG